MPLTIWALWLLRAIGKALCAAEDARRQDPPPEASAKALSEWAGTRPDDSGWP